MDLAGAPNSRVLKMNSPVNQINEIAAAEPATRKRLMTEAELREWLGISRDTITRYRRDPINPIPNYNYGKTYKYDEEEVRKWGKRNSLRIWKRTVAARRS